MEKKSKSKMQSEKAVEEVPEVGCAAPDASIASVQSELADRVEELSQVIICPQCGARINHKPNGKNPE